MVKSQKKIYSTKKKSSRSKRKSFRSKRKSPRSKRKSPRSKRKSSRSKRKSSRSKRKKVMKGGDKTCICCHESDQNTLPFFACKESKESKVGIESHKIKPLISYNHIHEQCLENAYAVEDYNKSNKKSILYKCMSLLKTGTNNNFIVNLNQRYNSSN